MRKIYIFIFVSKWIQAIIKIHKLIRSDEYIYYYFTYSILDSNPNHDEYMVLTL